MDMDLSIRFRMVQGAVDKFNFEKVHAYMTLVNWTYKDGKVPAMEDIKYMARFVCEELMYNRVDGVNHARVSRGGFEARLDNWNGKPSLSLAFIPVRAESSAE